MNFVYAFELVGLFPPVPILRRYLECVEENANVLLKKDPISPKAQVHFIFIYVISRFLKHMM